MSRADRLNDAVRHSAVEQWERHMEAKVAALGDMRSRACFAGGIGGSVDGRPATHVFFDGDIPIPLCRYHAAALTRNGYGAYRLPGEP